MVDYIRVTEVLKQFQDFSMIPPGRLEAAAERGPLVHEICERHLKGEAVTFVPPAARPYFEKFAKWRQSVIGEGAAAELRLYDDKLKLTGQIDLIARIRGDKGLSVIDIKTAKANSPLWRPQLAAYKHLAVLNGYPVERVMCLRFGAAKPIIDESTSTAAYDLAGFLHALHATTYFQNLRRK